MLSHGYTPQGLLDALIVSIPKNARGDIFSSENYRGIALSSAIAKLIDIIVLDRYGLSHLATSELQFAYKPKHSTTLCTFVLKELVYYYWSKHSDVFACFVDATKAFDKVSFAKLFQILVSKNLPIPFVRLIFDGYNRQRISAIWNTAQSEHFSVRNGVRQGAVLSAVLYIVYTDELLRRLEIEGSGCHIMKEYFGALAYADDVALISPTLQGLQQMISVMESFCNEFSIQLNTGKTKCLAFWRNRRVTPILQPILVNGNEIEWVEMFKYLGNFVTPDLSDTLDIEKKRGQFVQTANHVLHAFSVVKATLKCKLIQSYCTAFYGSQVWKLNNRNIEKIRTAWNIVHRRIWRLSNVSHSRYLPILANFNNALTQVHNRSCNFLRSAKNSDNSKVRFIYDISRINTLSITSVNVDYLTTLNANDGNQNGENSERICSQISELNDCLDGDRICGLNNDQIRSILLIIGSL